VRDSTLFYTYPSDRTFFGQSYQWGGGLLVIPYPGVHIHTYLLVYLGVCSAPCVLHKIRLRIARATPTFHQYILIMDAFRYIQTQHLLLFRLHYALQF
jgi:hypothetical protein